VDTLTLSRPQATVLYGGMKNVLAACEQQGAPLDPAAEIRNPNPKPETETRNSNPKPETRNPKPETRTRNPIPEPEPGTRNPKLEPETETRNPNPKPEPETRNPNLAPAGVKKVVRLSGLASGFRCVPLLLAFPQNGAHCIVR
jgi:hypothetical protein